MLLIVAVLGGFELYGRAKDWWRNRGTPGGNRYYAIKPWQRVAVGAVYVGLSGVLVLAHGRNAGSAGPPVTARPKTSGSSSAAIRTSRSTSR